MSLEIDESGGGDWEMLAPTNDGRVIQSVNSKAHKWIVQVTTNRDELKVITTKYYEHFYSECRGMLQSNYSRGALRMMSSTSTTAKTPSPRWRTCRSGSRAADGSSLLGTPAPPLLGPHPAKARQQPWPKWPLGEHSTCPPP